MIWPLPRVAGDSGSTISRKAQVGHHASADCDERFLQDNVRSEANIEKPSCHRAHPSQSHARARKDRSLTTALLTGTLRRMCPCKVQLELEGPSCRPGPNGPPYHAHTDVRHASGQNKSAHAEGKVPPFVASECQLWTVLFANPSSERNGTPQFQ